MTTLLPQQPEDQKHQQSCWEDPAFRDQELTRWMEAKGKKKGAGIYTGKGESKGTGKGEGKSTCEPRGSGEVEVKLCVQESGKDTEITYTPAESKGNGDS